ncbi:PTS system, D-glucosamine-specific IIC component/PTS system, glucose-specific IIA component [Evansella caseinilytica]|uniref:PTS system, D-glucosamine-specific IIC component/PTS system, glucose-specific IIA component n=1 Tax=Evansella caseinilytica TaxID=1503961 RepID=A0A1H3UV92_9BACI|nr:PTS glucose transporter subunit IIA [Evansella caseinilytica]SDZ65755.1 PTS system, D-glucosamine-specific IIC component/PTS system, glucose-specific IIA component [Evansella caseinilytica]
MFQMFKKKSLFVSPAAGNLKELEEVADEAFASKAMGDGFAIEPVEAAVYSPVHGTVELAFLTKHAIGLKSADGVEILIHVGVDTVSLNGEGFTLHIEQGQKIKQGDLLLTVDIPLIKDKVPSTDIIVVFTTGEQCRVLKAGRKVTSMEKDIITLEK